MSKGKRHSKSKGTTVTHSDWIERVIEEYEERAQAVVAAEAAAELEAAESLEDADTKQDIEEIFVDAGVDMGRCCSGTCRKKYPSTCSRRMCFDCCHAATLATIPDESGEIPLCKVHIARAKKLEEENKLLENYLGVKSSKKDREFRGAEERLDEINKTVVVWCFQDFCRNSRFSKVTFDHLERQETREKQSQRRWAAHEADASLSSAASPGAGTATKALSRNEKRKRCKYLQ